MFLAFTNILNLLFEVYHSVYSFLFKKVCEMSLFFLILHFCFFLSHLNTLKPQKSTKISLLKNLNFC